MPYVGSDDIQAGELATEHLVAIGRKRIAHIGGQGTSPSIDREHGFMNALAKHRRKLPENYIIRNERTEEGGDTVGYRSMQQLLKLRVRPDAVFCYNDLTAIGAIEAVLQAGLQVPGDVAVIGLRKSSFMPSTFVSPLSSIDQGTMELGRIAGEMALGTVRTAQFRTAFRPVAAHPGGARLHQGTVEHSPKLPAACGSSCKSHQNAIALPLTFSGGMLSAPKEKHHGNCDRTGKRCPAPCRYGRVG